MTLSEVNQLNFLMLSLEEVQHIHKRFGYIAVLSSGRIMGFKKEMEAQVFVSV